MSLLDDLEAAVKATEGRDGSCSRINDAEHFICCLSGQIQADHPQLADRIFALTKTERKS